MAKKRRKRTERHPDLFGEVSAADEEAKTVVRTDTKSGAVGTGADETKEDMFAEEVTLQLPARYACFGRVRGSQIEQLARKAETFPCRLLPFSTKRVTGFACDLPSGEALRILSRKTATNLGEGAVLLVPGADSPRAIAAALETGIGQWIAPRPVSPADEAEDTTVARCREVLRSWEGKVHIREGRKEADGEAAIPGLRRPQVGALYAALAHGTRSSAPATIVMPTGTGKTETMLAIHVCERVERVLVVVPTDALREQIAHKFRDLGVLKSQAILAPDALYPVVVQLEHIPHSVREVDEIFLRANVIVTTMQIAGRSSAEVQERMADRVSALFIDEAHHIGARTWSDFRALFVERAVPVRVLQFTATPFREDGRRVDGEFIYTYPLKKAQEEEYFTKIRFEAVFGLDQAEADNAIIDKLGEVLEEDLAKGFNHLAMARCSSIERAKALHSLYASQYPQHRPVIVHSKQTGAQRNAALRAIRNFESRIIVCVDMLGEGFDLPQLKIAAMHDHHKSIAVTIQFVGRFTRILNTIGEATVIANTGVDDVERSLAKLYAEDADWNTLVEALSAANIGRQVRRAELFQGFVGDMTDIPLQTLQPKTNAVIYSTRCANWDPLKAEDVYGPGPYLGMKLNARDRLAIFVVREEEGATWTSAQHAVNVTWHLFMMHWDETKNLLYINSSAKGPFDRLATAVCGEGVRRIQGEQVFRCLHGFKRLIIRNLGLTHHQGRGVRFSMYMGVDVAEGLDSAKSQARIKNNAFGAGYVDGVPVSRGCSAKGKFWALSPVHDLSDWIDWCREIGGMVTDAGISTDDVFASAMKPRLISSRPAVPPVAINWPEGLLTQVEERIEINLAGRVVSFAECDIDLASNDADGPLRFVVISDRDRAEFEIVFQDGAASYPQRGGPRAIVKVAGKEKLLSDYFGDDSPHIDFGDGSLLIYSHLYVLPEDRVVPPFAKSKIEVWDWSGVDIRKESQGPTKDRDSIQRRVIDQLISAGEPYDIIFDDDDPGEIADVVAIRITESLISVTFFHCKYSSGDTPGSRVKDLYEVCGQAQKSARWRDRPNRMFKHMLKRERLRLDRGQGSRFEQGSAALLKKLNAMWQEYRYEYQVRIVQPGLSKDRIELEPLHLLAGAETYLLETRAMPVLVIASS